MSADLRWLIVYGARCTWWDSIDKAGRLSAVSQHLPCCPHCKSVLFQIDEWKWSAGVRKHEESGHPGYGAMMAWARGKCFPNMVALKEAFLASKVTP